MIVLIRCLLLMALASFVWGSVGCKGCIGLDSDDFARMIKSGDIAAGKQMPQPQDRMAHYHWGWEEADSHVGTEGDRFDTYIAKDRKRVITIYAHNGVAFAACTVAEQRYDIQAPPPTIIWHFFDADLMERHVSVCQENLRKAEAARREYLRYHGRETEQLWP